MKKVRKQAKFRRFKDRVRYLHYRKPFLMISTDIFRPEGLELIFNYCCTIYNTDNIKVIIGNFKDGLAPVYVMRKYFNNQR